MKKGRLWKWAKIAYRWIFRPVIKRAIKDPYSDIDEAVLLLLDKLFNYKQNGTD